MFLALIFSIIIILNTLIKKNVLTPWSGILISASIFIALLPIVLNILIDSTVLLQNDLSIPIHFENVRKFQSFFFFLSLLLAIIGSYIQFRELERVDKYYSDLMVEAKKYKDIIETSEVAIFLTDLSGKIIFQNKKLTEILHYTSKQISSVNIFDFILQDDREKIRTLFQEIIDNYEQEPVTSQEKLQWIIDELLEHVPYQFILVSDDLIYESPKNIIISRDVSAIKAQQIQKRLEKVITENFGEKLYEVAKTKSDKRKFYGLGKSSHCEFRVVDTKNNIIWLKVIFAPVIEAGNVVGMQTYAWDITHEKETKELKDRFIATTSHELRTPVTVLKGYTDFLLTNPEIPTDMKKRIYVNMSDNIDRLIRLINAVHDVSRISKDLFDISPQPIYLDNFIEAIHEHCFLLYPQRSITINYIPYVNKKTIHIDKDRILQVIDNLVSNAIKNSPQKSSVEITLITDLNKLLLSVQDYGSGIPFDMFIRLFQPFSHRNTLYSAKGAGLGLFIVKNIIFTHGGTIEVLSKENSGTTVIVTIPDGFQKFSAVT